MLHGDIQINEVTVGGYTVERDKSVGNGHYFYKCFVFDRDLQGYPREAEFIVIHEDAAGPLVLLGKVLVESEHRLQRRSLFHGTDD